MQEIEKAFKLFWNIIDKNNRRDFFTLDEVSKVQTFTVRVPSLSCHLDLTYFRFRIRWQNSILFDILLPATDNPTYDMPVKILVLGSMSELDLNIDVMNNQFDTAINEIFKSLNTVLGNVVSQQERMIKAWENEKV